MHIFEVHAANKYQPALKITIMHFKCRNGLIQGHVEALKTNLSKSLISHSLLFMQQMHAV